jgi:hypothetical protein
VEFAQQLVVQNSDINLFGTLQLVLEKKNMWMDKHAFPIKLYALSEKNQVEWPIVAFCWRKMVRLIKTSVGIETPGHYSLSLVLTFRKWKYDNIKLRERRS